MNSPSTSGSNKNATTNLKKLRSSTCFVPKCPSNSIKFPKKMFVTGPSNPKLREKWFKAAMRDERYSPKTVIRCCEDHFDLEKDIENWMKLKLIGGRISLKKGAVPHYFDCQNRMPKIKSEIVQEKETFKITENTNSETQNHSNRVPHYFDSQNRVPKIKSEIVQESETFKITENTNSETQNHSNTVPHYFDSQNRVPKIKSEIVQESETFKITENTNSETQNHSNTVPHYFDSKNRMPKIKSEIVQESETFKITENTNSETQNHSNTVPHYFDSQNRVPKIKSEIVQESETFKITENMNSETQNHSNTDATSSQTEKPKELINRIKVVPYRKILPKRPTTATADIANAIGTYARLRKVQLIANRSNNRDGLASGARHITLLPLKVKQSSDESEHIEVYSHKTPQKQANLTNSQRTPIRQNCHETIHSSDDASYEYDTGTESSSESNSDECHKPPNEKLCHITVHRIMAKPMLYLGIPPSCSLILQFLQKQLKCKFHHICLVLKKLRLNESFAILADDFDLHESTACSIFSRSCLKMAAILKKFITLPSRSSILANLPINFRNYYLETYCLIDCLEIEIEPPIDSVHQTQTYSSRNKCNTMKYLVSATPDGIINFVSDGFGGRTSDLTIFKESKIIDALPPGTSIMVHRGFKDIEGVLAKNHLQLIRPPSVNGLKQTSQDVLTSKEIENPWTHIEIIIQRLQEFSFLKAHACLDHYLIPNLDHAMTVCCALVNLQSPLIKTEITE